MSRLIAGFFGAGTSPVAPGTVGSLAALVVGAGLLCISHAALAFAATLASIGGYFAVRRTVADRTADPRWVVIDEVAGQWIAMLALPRVTTPGLIAAFVLFRVFDITKPGPIGWADRKPGAFGIMADDVLAGAASVAVLGTLRLVWPELLG